MVSTSSNSTNTRLAGFVAISWISVKVLVTCLPLSLNHLLRSALASISISLLLVNRVPRRIVAFCASARLEHVSHVNNERYGELYQRVVLPEPAGP